MPKLSDAEVITMEIVGA